MENISSLSQDEEDLFFPARKRLKKMQKNSDACKKLIAFSSQSDEKEDKNESEEENNNFIINSSYKKDEKYMCDEKKQRCTLNYERVLSVLAYIVSLNHKKQWPWLGGEKGQYLHIFIINFLIYLILV
jgi:hypothetical protein